MPLVRQESGELLLVCASHGDGNHGSGTSTMRALPGWRALVVAHASGDRLDPNEGTPLRCYVCSICGYVESYLAQRVAPEEWPALVAHEKGI